MKNRKIWKKAFSGILSAAMLMSHAAGMVTVQAEDFAEEVMLENAGASEETWSEELNLSAEAESMAEQLEENNEDAVQAEPASGELDFVDAGEASDFLAASALDMSSSDITGIEVIDYNPLRITYGDYSVFSSSEDFSVRVSFQDGTTLEIEPWTLEWYELDLNCYDTFTEDGQVFCVAVGDDNYDDNRIEVLVPTQTVTVEEYGTELSLLSEYSCTVDNSKDIKAFYFTPAETGLYNLEFGYGNQSYDVRYTVSAINSNTTSSSRRTVSDENGSQSHDIVMSAGITYVFFCEYSEFSNALEASVQVKKEETEFTRLTEGQIVNYEGAGDGTRFLYYSFTPEQTGIYRIMNQFQDDENYSGYFEVTNGADQNSGSMEEPTTEPVVAWEGLLESGHTYPILLYLNSYNIEGSFYLDYFGNISGIEGIENSYSCNTPVSEMLEGASVLIEGKDGSIQNIPFETQQQSIGNHTWKLLLTNEHEGFYFWDEVVGSSGTYYATVYLEDSILYKVPIELTGSGDDDDFDGDFDSSDDNLNYAGQPVATYFNSAQALIPNGEEASYANVTSENYQYFQFTAEEDGDYAVISDGNRVSEWGWNDMANAWVSMNVYSVNDNGLLVLAGSKTDYSPSVSLRCRNGETYYVVLYQNDYNTDSVGEGKIHVVKKAAVDSLTLNFGPDQPTFDVTEFSSTVMEISANVVYADDTSENVVFSQADWRWDAEDNLWIEYTGTGKFGDYFSLQVKDSDGNPTTIYGHGGDCPSGNITLTGYAMSNPSISDSVSAAIIGTVPENAPVLSVGGEANYELEYGGNCQWFELNVPSGEYRLASSNQIKMDVYEITPDGWYHKVSSSIYENEPDSEKTYLDYYTPYGSLLTIRPKAGNRYAVQLANRYNLGTQTGKVYLNVPYTLADVVYTDFPEMEANEFEQSLNDFVKLTYAAGNHPELEWTLFPTLDDGILFADGVTRNGEHVMVAVDSEYGSVIDQNGILKPGTWHVTSTYQPSRTEEYYNGTITITGDVHEHTYGDWIVTVEPTCTMLGVQVQKCTICGEVLFEESTERLEHTAGDWEIQQEVTCTENGLKVKKCTVCGEVVAADDIYTAGHNWSEYTVTKNPTVKAAGQKTRTCSVCETVSSRRIAKLKPTIEVSAKSASIKVNASKTITVKMARGDAVDSWESSNAKVAKVSKTGKITGVKAGTATVTVTLKSGISAKIKVTVKDILTKSIKVTAVNNKISKNKMTMKKGKTDTLKVTLNPTNSTQKVTYSSSNKNVVAVSAAGKLTAKKKGSAVITVKSGKKSVKITVTVK